MKKIVASVLAIAMAAIVLVGCGGGASTTTETKSTTEDTSTGKIAAYTEEDLGKDFVFKHGFDQEFPPYAYRNDNGETGGFDVELAQAVCDYYGWKYEPVPFNWDAKDMELNAGSCDCIWSGFTINGREDNYLWSMPYSDNEQMILVKKNSDIKKLDDLAGKNVGVQTDTSAYTMLKEGEQKELASKFGNLQVFPDYTTAFTELKAGSIDAIAIDITTGDHLIKDEKDYGYLEEKLGNEQYGIGFRKGDDVLCKKVNEALDALVADGTFAKLGEKYPEIQPYLSLGKK